VAFVHKILIIDIFNHIASAKSCGILAASDIIMKMLLQEMVARRIGRFIGLENQGYLFHYGEYV